MVWPQIEDQRTTSGDPVKWTTNKRLHTYVHLYLCSQHAQMWTWIGVVLLNCCCFIWRWCADMLEWWCWSDACSSAESVEWTMFDSVNWLWNMTNELCVADCMSRHLKLNTYIQTFIIFSACDRHLVLQRCLIINRKNALQKKVCSFSAKNHVLF